MGVLRIRNLAYTSRHRCDDAAFLAIWPGGGVLSKPRGQKRCTVYKRISNLRLQAGSQSKNKNKVQVTSSSLVALFWGGVMFMKRLFLTILVLISTITFAVAENNASTQPQIKLIAQLYNAATNGDLEIAKKAIEAGVDINGDFISITSEPDSKLISGYFSS